MEDHEEKRTLWAASASAERKRYLIHSEGDDGSISSYPLSRNLYLFVIDIHSMTIPEFGSGAVPEGRMVKFNYCRHGRCELITRSGSYTYLVGGEVAVDTGQTNNQFYYPTSEYCGIELIFIMDEDLKEIPGLGAYSGVMQNAGLKNIDVMTQPLNFSADEIIAGIADEIRVYDEKDTGSSIMLLKGLELLIWLAGQLPGKQNIQRKFYTTSQVEIARHCHDLIIEDLSTRWSAGKLARRFGVSETSVKNYFRNVYGYGFQEFQIGTRMELAAEKLSATDEPVGDIARSLGYSSQTKFGNAFRAYHGCLPMEYRRRYRIGPLME